MEFVYIDDRLAVVNKPAGLPVHKNPHLPRDHEYLTKWIGKETDREVYPVHRLDAKTSGVVACAFSRETADLLARQFRNRTVKKEYLALVKGNPGSGTYEHVLWDRHRKKKLKAISAFETLKTVKTQVPGKDGKPVDISLVRILPKTGRWHQIRMQFGIERHDILGDVQHGDWTLNKLIAEVTGIRRMFLHASAIAFEHPATGETVRYEAGVPEEFGRVMESLATD